MAFAYKKEEVRSDALSSTDGLCLIQPIKNEKYH